MTLLAALLTWLVRAPFAAWVIVAALGVSASAAAERPGKAAIRGVVLEEGSDRPIAGAWLIIDRFGAPEPPAWVNAPPVAPAATTDREGRFEIADIEPGSYTLTVMRTGYARRVYGQRVERGHVPPMALTAGDEKDLAIRLTPTGSVSGAVRDSAGRPVAGVGVRLVRPTYTSSGARGVTDVVGTTSDDRGEYRFYWVTPGRYFVQAGSGNMTRGDLTPIESFDQHGLAAGNVVRGDYARTYYPGVREIAQALAVDIRPRSELSAIDITLEPGQWFAIGGQVIDARTGQSRLEGRIVIYESASLNGIGGFSFEGDSYGLGRVRPGTYWLGFRTDDEPAAVAAAEVVVADADVDVAVTLAPPSTIKGRVVVDGALAPAALQNFSFVARPWSDRTLAGFLEFLDHTLFTKADVGTDGTFTIHGLASTALCVTPFRWPQGFYLKDARLDGVDVLNAPAPFSPGSALEVVISSRGGRIEGTVIGDRSSPAQNVQVVLVPDARRDRTELFKSVETDSAGRFSITGIAPGDYRLLAWEALEPYAWFDPDVLRPFESVGLPIHVSESSAQSVDVRMIPAEGAR